MLEINAIGNIGKDAEIKSYENFNYLDFSIGINEKKDLTTWVNCRYFGTEKHLTTLIPYFKKGQKLFISCDFKTRIYNEKVIIDARVNRFKLI